jgi:ABC-2 type transport system permease protein
LLLQTPIQTALFGANSGGFTQFLTSVSIPFYVLFLVYFVLEFFMYASIYAGLGALVKRSEEVQSLVMVPTLLLAAFFVVTFFGFAHPDADWVRVLSYIPCFTPTFVLLRLALGTVAWWEIVLTILLMLGTTFAFALVAVQVYRLGVLMYGQRPTLGQLVRIMRSTNSRNAAEADKTVE